MPGMSKAKKDFTHNLREAADELDKYCATVNKFSLCGTAAVVFGLTAAAFSTGGCSFFIATALIGSGVKLGAQAYGEIIEHKKLEEMEKQWTEFQTKFKKSYKMPQASLESKTPNLKEECRQFLEAVTSTETQPVLRFLGIVPSIQELMDASVKLSDKSNGGQILRALADAVEKTCKRKRRFCCCCC